MNENYSRASKKRWAKIPAKKRSEMMRTTALKRWENATDKERLDQAMIMVEGKRKIANVRKD